MTTTRRQLLGRGVTLAASASLLTASTARAQADEETDALERLVELEQAVELAYSITEQDEALRGGLATLAESFRAHEGAHADALSSALDQLGVDPPESSDDPASYEALEGIDNAKSAGQRLDFLIGVEEQLVTAYETETVNLEAGDLFRTAAQIAANHSQHLVALRLERGDTPAEAARLPSRVKPE